MRSHQVEGPQPFHQVVLQGLVLAADGREFRLLGGKYRLLGLDARLDFANSGLLAGVVGVEPGEFVEQRPLLFAALAEQILVAADLLLQAADGERARRLAGRGRLAGGRRQQAGENEAMAHGRLSYWMGTSVGAPASCSCRRCMYIASKLTGCSTIGWKPARVTRSETASRA